jgi:dTDP-4-amino-4,6-dideoxygalactose transaminase
LFSPAPAERDVQLHAAISRVIERHRYILGPEVAKFEHAFADYCGVANCVTVANGTDALAIAMRALELRSGDRVAMVANAGPYASCAARTIGAEPLFVDVDPATRTMSPDSLQAIVDQVGAVVVTHLYGQLADIDALTRIADSAGVPVIEDCAQAHGASRNDRRAGAFGIMGCFSFYPTKNLGALGDGGAIVTDDGALATRIRSLRQYGWGDKYSVELRGGLNSRLDEIQAAVLLEKLPRLGSWNVQRRQIAARYREAFGDLPIGLPPSVGEDFVAHLFVIEVDARDHFRASLAKSGVDTDIHYPVPDHMQPAYVDEAESVPSLPATERLCTRVVSIPVFPGLREDEIDAVVDAVRCACDRVLC